MKSEIKEEIVETARGGCLDALTQLISRGSLGIETQKIKQSVPDTPDFFGPLEQPDIIDGRYRIFYFTKRKVVKNKPPASV